MGRYLLPLGCLLVVCAAGCPSSVTERNAFLTLTEQFGTFISEEEDTGVARGTGAEGEFRSEMTLTFANNNPDAELETAFVAWVSVASIRTAEQQDALLLDGYIQLRREERLGTAFTLPPGTFVYGGAGVAGSTTIQLRRAAAADEGAIVTATAESITLVTPDAVLVFEHPPVSCDSVAFRFVSEGENFLSEPLDGALGIFEGATGGGGLKVLAQVQGYQCDPLKPGLFLKLGGGVKQLNEYFEGEDIRFDFNPVPDANGDFALVTVSGAGAVGGGDGTAP